jgi:ribosome-associated heat shock protein Hsp15
LKFWKLSEGIRIDKWLWAVRIFKTRSQATEACKNAKVLIEGNIVKPSRTLALGDIITIKKPPYTFIYEVTGLIGKRVSASLAAENVKDLTPPDELIRIKTIQESAFYKREKGSGRPTKKERRLIDRLRQ